MRRLAALLPWLLLALAVADWALLRREALDHAPALLAGLTPC